MGVLHLYRDDFSWLYADARFLLHCRIDGEDSLGADAATARSSVLFQDNHAESLLRGLDGGREAGVSCAADADVARVGCHGVALYVRCGGRFFGLARFVFRA